MHTTSTIRRKDTGLSDSSNGSHHSDESQESESTAPTSLYDSPRPSLQYSRPEAGSYDFSQSYDLSPAAMCYPRASTETYASTTASQEEFVEEPEPYDPDYQVSESPEVYHPNLLASTPSDFADYFPSTRRLYIRHDDTTYDGNMNLRVDTRAGTTSHPVDIRLFHMRMLDLKKREFSLRRYERSSGREVCHSSRKYAKPSHEGKSNIQKSMSSAFSSIIGKPEFKRTNSGLSMRSSKGRGMPRRQDSGYASYNDDDEVSSLSDKLKDTSLQVPTNTTKLEFSNYAQVEVKRRGGGKTSKRYEFEYWGHDYQWKRVIRRESETQEVTYHLYRDENGPVVAQMFPDIRSHAQIRADQAAGNWIPPMSMWICDQSVLNASSDVADVIVATGLIALVDDCIKRHFHRHHHKRHVRQVGVPLTPLKVDMEFVSPKVMMEHMFRRRNSAGSTKEKDHHRGSSPLKNSNYVEVY